MGEAGEVPNTVAFAGAIENPGDRQLHYAFTMGGAQVEVDHGDRTRLEGVEHDKKSVSGTVVTSDGRPVRTGTILVRLRARGEDRTADAYVEGNADGGRFQISLADAPIEWESLDVYFLPGSGLAPSEIHLT